MCWSKFWYMYLATRSISVLCLQSYFSNKIEQFGYIFTYKKHFVFLKLKNIKVWYLNVSLYYDFVAIHFLSLSCIKTFSVGVGPQSTVSSSTFIKQLKKICAFFTIKAWCGLSGRPLFVNVDARPSTAFWKAFSRRHNRFSLGRRKPWLLGCFFGQHNIAASFGMF